MVQKSLCWTATNSLSMWNFACKNYYCRLHYVPFCEVFSILILPDHLVKCVFTFNIHLWWGYNIIRTSWWGTWISQPFYLSALRILLNHWLCRRPYGLDVFYHMFYFYIVHLNKMSRIIFGHVVQSFKYNIFRSWRGGDKENSK